MSYEDHLATLLAVQIAPDSTNADLCQLFGALGCHYVAGIPEDDTRLVSPTQPGRVHDALITHTLMTLLRSQLERFPLLEAEHCYAIMGGLCHNERWRTCLASSEAAFYFATLLIHHAHVTPNCADGYTLRGLIDLPVYNVLAKWLLYQDSSVGQPGSWLPRDECSGTHLLAKAIFGEAWCSIAIDKSDDRGGLIPAIIRAQRPPVQQHLLPMSAWLAMEDLPKLGTL